MRVPQTEGTRGSLKWLQRHWAVAALAGGLSGPLSFFAGERMGAVVFHDTWIAVAAISAGWAVLLPAVVALARRVDGDRMAVPMTSQGA